MSLKEALQIFAAIPTDALPNLVVLAALFVVIRALELTSKALSGKKGR